MVSAEDAHGELAARLVGLRNEATHIVDIGAGTGRLTVPLCVAGTHVHAVDIAPAMLEEWSETKQAPRHASWLHELEFTDDIE